MASTLSMATAAASSPPRTRVWPAILFQGAFVGGVAVFKAAVTAMVVARLSAAVLPPIYIAAALATAILAPAQGALIRSHRPPRTWLSVSMLITIALGWLAFSGHSAAGAAVVALYLFAEVYATLTSLRFWSAIGEVFDAREGKRVFALVSGAGMAGSIVGGLIAKAVGVELGAAGFLAIAVGSMLLCRLLVFQLAAAKAEGNSGEAPSAKEGFRLLMGDHYARGVAILVAVLSALTVCVDYVFRLRAGESMGENQLAALFGEVSFWVGVVAMTFQLTVAGRLLSRLGIFRYLLIVPLGTFVLTLGAVVSPALWPVFALKVLEQAGSLSINPTAIQLLYAPLSDKTRLLARSVIDGLVKKGGLAVGGALLLVGGGIAGLWTAIPLAAASAVAVMVVALRLKARYVAALDARLTRAAWSTDFKDDAKARAFLLGALDDPNPTRALLAVSLLESRSSEALRAKLPVLLTHPSERVRERAVRAAVALGAVETVPTLTDMARNDTRRPRYQAVRALAVLAVNGRELLRPLLASSDLGVQTAAIGALVKLETAASDRDGEAGRALRRLLASGGGVNAAERRETARLLGDIAETGVLHSIHATHLESYLRDEDASVRRIAAAAAGRTRLLNLVPSLVEMLGRAPERREALSALCYYGEELVPVLAYLLNDRALPAAVRYEVPRLLRCIGGARAAEVLLFSNIQDDPMLRQRIAHALSRLRREQPDLPMDTERVQQAIGRRVDAFVYYRAVASDLSQLLAGQGLLLRTLNDRLDQNVEIVFRLLGLLFPHDTVMRVYEHFCSPSRRDRACAVELLDNMLPASLRSRVAPLLESPPTSYGLCDLDKVMGRLAELAMSRDPVLAGVAIYTARTLVPNALTLQIPEEGFVSESIIEKVFLIERVNIFANSDVDDLIALAAIAHERRYEAEEVIYDDDSPGDAVHIIIEGAVRMERDGRELLVLGPTESFGEASLLDGEPHVARAVASAPTRVLWISRQDFLDLVADRPELLKCVFASLTRSLRRVVDVAAAGKIATA